MKIVINILFMKQHFVVTHTVQQTEIHTLLDSWLTKAPSVKMLDPQKIAGPYIFAKKKHAQVSVYWWSVKCFSLL